MCRRFESAPRHQARNATSCMLPALLFRGPRLSTRRTALGAEGGSRTHTGQAQRFLRPSRLPFRHFGNTTTILSQHENRPRQPALAMANSASRRNQRRHEQRVQRNEDSDTLEMQMNFRANLCAS